MQSEAAGALLVNVVVFALGLALVAATVSAALKTFVLPRGINVRLTAVVFHGVRALFRLRIRRAASYEERDRVMALFAPVTLLVLPVVFLTLTLLGYAAIFWAAGQRPFTQALRLSGSSLLTLGYISGDTLTFKLLEFSEAMLGLILVALLIAYLPTMYAAFTRRETAVALLESYASTPPSAAELISRAHRTGELRNLRQFWMTWQTWFAEIEESHTSFASLAFFRSPQSGRSWITAAGTVLDSASLILALVDIPMEPRAAFCIRSGYLALRQIADFFRIDHNANPAPGDPISISRVEFDEVCARLAQDGVPLVADLDQAWRDFAGWRVNYDTVLLGLAALTMAPYAPWSSDRSSVVQRS